MKSLSGTCESGSEGVQRLGGAALGGQLVDGIKASSLAAPAQSAIGGGQHEINVSVFVDVWPRRDRPKPGG